jgi:hypothetical protein
VAVGDAVATTAPTAGRGIAMASMQIAQLLELLDAGTDPATIADVFGAWCDTWIRPWSRTTSRWTPNRSVAGTATTSISRTP